MIYIKEMRIAHYLKNVLIFLPLIFSGNLFNYKLIILSIAGFISFCFMSSCVYVINDIKDIEKDKLHHKKKYRPIASGAISINHAKFFALILFVISIFISIITINYGCSVTTLFILLIYLVVNILYSVVGLKKIPILDVFLLASGFILRLLMGSLLTDIAISQWLYLVVLSGAFYMGFGKRRNELQQNADSTRDVLSKYEEGYLDKSMYSCMTLTIIFFSLWCMEKSQSSDIANFMILIPLIMLAFFKYNYNIENKESDGDPINVIINDKILIGLSVIIGITIIILLYI